MTKFTYASAFAGIGGMTLGLKPLGGKGVIAWEYDPTEKRRQYAQDAHRLLHPEIPVYGDICEADTAELPYFDVLCFTPPCQSYSVAGKRKGANFICTSCDTVFVPEVSAYEHLMTECKACGSLAVPEDDRGVLTYQAIRIAKAKRPKALFMENVKGLVNHDVGNTLKSIIQSINQIGYTVDFTVLNSKYFDVAQNRERVYLIAIRDDLITPEPWNDAKGTTMLPKAKKRYQEEGARTFNFDWPEQTEVRTRLRDFLEPIVDEKYYIDEDKTAKLVAQLEKNYPAVDERDPNMLGHIDLKGHDAIKRVYSPTGQGPTLTTMGGGHREPKIAEKGPRYRIRKLTPRECLRLQSVPEDVIDALSTEFSDSRLYKFAGNGLTTNVITAIGERLLTYL